MNLPMVKYSTARKGGKLLRQFQGTHNGETVNTARLEKNNKSRSFVWSGRESGRVTTDPSAI